MPPICYRVTNIPKTWSESHVQESLCYLDALAFSTSPTNPVNIGLFPSLFGETKTAIVTTMQEACSGSSPRSFKVSDPTNNGDVVHLTIDSAFFGLTPLNTPKQDVVADIVAVRHF